VVVSGPVLQHVTQTAAEIQSNTKVKNKDHRVFLDGIYQFYKEKGIEK
jgi:large subunit ribosomal protein L6